MCTVHLVQFIIQTNKCTTCIYTYTILYIISTPTCFNASASYSGRLLLLFFKVTKIIKIIKLNKSS